VQIAVFEGYRIPRRGKGKGRKMKTAMRAKMKACARKHKVATKGFWTCVRGGKKRR
jgi:hypothetical protein